MQVGSRHVALLILNCITDEAPVGSGHAMLQNLKMICVRRHSRKDKSQVVGSIGYGKSTRLPKRSAARRWISDNKAGGVVGWPGQRAVSQLKIQIRREMRN